MATPDGVADGESHREACLILAIQATHLLAQRKRRLTRWRPIDESRFHVGPQGESYVPCHGQKSSRCWRPACKASRSRKRLTAIHDVRLIICGIGVASASPK